MPGGTGAGVDAHVAEDRVEGQAVAAEADVIEELGEGDGLEVCPK